MERSRSEFESGRKGDVGEEVVEEVGEECGSALVMVGENQWRDQDLNLNQAEKVMWERRWLRRWERSVAVQLRRWLRSLFPKLRVIERLDCQYYCIYVYMLLY